MSTAFIACYVSVNLCSVDGTRLALFFLKPSRKIKHLTCYLVGWSDFRCLMWLT